MPKQETRTFWEKGIDNRRSRDRLQNGFVHDMINMDPLLGGNLGVRTGYEQIYSGTDVRGILALGDTRLLIADGTDLVEYNLDAGSTRVLRTIAGAGAFAGAEHNGELFFCTANECLRYDGDTVRRWGVPTVTVAPAVSAAAGGNIVSGYYKFAVTYVNEYGEEGGTYAFTIQEVEGTVTLTAPTAPAGYQYRFYAGFQDSTEVYLQATSTAASIALTALTDKSTTLETAFMTEPAPGHLVCAADGVVYSASGNAVYRTEPFRPHLRREMAGFFQYPAPVDVLIDAPAGIVVCADATYLITGAQTKAPSQTQPLDFGGVRGTAAKLPDGRVTWMTQYGPAVAGGEGVALLSKDWFAPMLASEGAAGIIDHNGSQLAVTTMRGIPRSNPLATGDFYEAEVINP